MKTTNDPHRLHPFADASQLWDLAVSSSQPWQFHSPGVLFGLQIEVPDFKEPVTIPGGRDKYAWPGRKDTPPTRSDTPIDYGPMGGFRGLVKLIPVYESQGDALGDQEDRDWLPWYYRSYNNNVEKLRELWNAYFNRITGGGPPLTVGQSAAAQSLHGALSKAADRMNQLRQVHNALFDSSTYGSGPFLAPQPDLVELENTARKLMHIKELLVQLASKCVERLGP